MASLNIESDVDTEISQKLEALKIATSQIKAGVHQLTAAQEEMTSEYNRNETSLAFILNQPIDLIPPEMLREVQSNQQETKYLLDLKATSLVNSLMYIQEKLQDALNELKPLQKIILDNELISWKRNKKLAGNGKRSCLLKLDEIQTWCESLADITWSNLDSIKGCEALCSRFPLHAGNYLDQLPTLKNGFVNLFSSLVTSTFVIVEEPPQILLKNIKFSATVRLLVGKMPGLIMTELTASVAILNEAQSQTLFRRCSASLTGTSGKITNSKGSIVDDQKSRQLSISFRKMKLEEISRSGTSGMQSVLDEKFALLFQSKFSINGEEFVFEVWTLSLPLVVIAHANQKPQASGTIAWDNASAERTRVPFNVPDQIPWTQLAEMLDMKFAESTGLRGLTAENLDFLATKAFRSSHIGDCSKMMLTWAQFCKDPLPNSEFTFWKWFYGILQVTKDYLSHLWNEGAILGFVGRSKAEELLRMSPPGTFLLRFSDTEVGGISIALLCEDANKGGQRDVYMIKPLTCTDLAIRPLPDRIADLPNLRFLFPSTPKDYVFRKYYSQLPLNSVKGYVIPTFISLVPGLPALTSSCGQSDNRLNERLVTTDIERHIKHLIASYSNSNILPDLNFFDLDRLLSNQGYCNKGRKGFQN